MKNKERIENLERRIIELELTVANLLRLASKPSKLDTYYGPKPVMPVYPKPPLEITCDALKASDLNPACEWPFIYI